jgi:hypothetical protein
MTTTGHFLGITGHKLGMQVRHADTLRGLLRAGLPLSENAPVGRLLDLRGVVARAANPGERASRVRALDALLRWQLARFEHPRLAGAVRLLFGADRTSEGLTLTERREKAAAAAGYEVHHFRKRVEPEICEHLARMLGSDSEDLLSRALPPVLGQARRPMRLPADVFAWEAAEHEEALSGLWSAVYALRAALLAVSRLASMDGAASLHAQQAAQTVLWRLVRLLDAAAGYRTAYGPVLLGSDPPADPAELAQLAGWFPLLREADKEVLAELAARYNHRDNFLEGITSSPAAAGAKTWCHDLASQTEPTRGDAS